MALTSRSLFLYGFEVTTLNNAIDFKITGPGSTLQATLSLGYYSLTSLMTEIKRAMEAADITNTYTVTADRTYSGGLQNRVTISTSGAFLSLLFLSGPRTASSVKFLIGFPNVDQVSALTYTGTSSAGTVLSPVYNAYNYLGPEFSRRVFGAVNVSASGLKESVVWNIQQFVECEFKYEAQATVLTDWLPFWNWAIQQRPFEITPQVSVPATFYPVTLESTGEDSKGLAFKMTEMLPQFPFYFMTGKMKLRRIT